MRIISIDGRKIIVINRKIRRPKKIVELVQATKKYEDPSHESEKPKNPLVFVKTSFAKAFRAKPIWEDIRIPPSHLRNIFGDPTRICRDRIEWVVKLPSKEIVKIVVDHRGAAIHGFERTVTLEKWVERLFNS